MTIHPTVRPAITLDFQKGKQLDPRISFSRSSSATYVEGGVIKTADEHQARFEEEGLLIEENRINMITDSEDMDTSYFLFNTNVTNSVMDSPKGSSSVSLVEATANSNLVSAQYLVYNIGNVYTLSAFVKKGNNQWVRLGHVSSSAGCWFDLDNGVTGTVNSQRATMTAYANGWYRITNTFIATETGPQPNAGGVPQLAFLSLSSGDGNNTASAGQNIYVWGMQVEAGGFPTSYIPTTGATATRAADIASITGDNFSSWYNQGEGTLFYKYTATGGNQFLSPASIRATNGQDAQSWGYWMYSGGGQYRSPNAGQRKSPTEQVFLGDGNIFTQTIMGQSYKVAVGHDNSTLSGCLEGYSVQSSTITSLPTMTEFRIGVIKNNSNNRFTGHISRLSYYSERLTDEQLEVITS